MGTLMGISRENGSPFPFPTFPLPEGEGKWETKETGKPDGKFDGKRETAEEVLRVNSPLARAPLKEEA